MEVRLPDGDARSRCAELVLPHLNSAYNLARWLSRNDADADAQALVRAIAGLPVGFREVLLLREQEDMSYRDIARVVDIPIGTVMSRLARARGLLRRSPLLHSVLPQSMRTVGK